LHDHLFRQSIYIWFVQALLRHINVKEAPVCSQNRIHPLLFINKKLIV